MGSGIIDTKIAVYQSFLPRSIPRFSPLPYLLRSGASAPGKLAVRQPLSDQGHRGGYGEAATVLDLGNL